MGIGCGECFHRQNLGNRSESISWEATRNTPQPLKKRVVVYTHNRSTQEETSSIGIKKLCAKCWYVREQMDRHRVTMMI